MGISRITNHVYAARNERLDILRNSFTVCRNALFFEVGKDASYCSRMRLVSLFFQKLFDAKEPVLMIYIITLYLRDCERQSSSESR